MSYVKFYLISFFSLTALTFALPSNATELMECDVSVLDLPVISVAKPFNEFLKCGSGLKKDMCLALFKPGMTNFEALFQQFLKDFNITCPPGFQLDLDKARAASQATLDMIAKAFCDCLGISDAAKQQVCLNAVNGQWNNLLKGIRDKVIQAACVAIPPPPKTGPCDPSRAQCIINSVTE